MTSWQRGMASKTDVSTCCIKSHNLGNKSDDTLTISQMTKGSAPPGPKWRGPPKRLSTP